MNWIADLLIIINDDFSFTWWIDYQCTNVQVFIGTHTHNLLHYFCDLYHDLNYFNEIELDCLNNIDHHELCDEF